MNGVIRSQLDLLRRKLTLGDANNLVSPSFLALPPSVKHFHRIPEAPLASMSLAWQQIWYSPRLVRFSILQDVFVAADGLVLKSDGSLIPETVEQHSAVSVEKARLAVKNILKLDCPRLFGNVVLCRKPGSGTYGHWLVELLPKAYLATHWPEPSRYLVQALPDRQMSSLTAQTLASIGIGKQSIVAASSDPVWVERLIMIHGLTEHGGYMSPLTVECLQAITDRVMPNGPENIFVVRPPDLGRQLADGRRVLAEAQRAGFTILDPGSMPFTSQVATFKAARRIVGVMGSALANIAFAQSSTRVSLLAPSAMPDTFFWFLGGHRSLDVTEFRCLTKKISFYPNYFIDEVVVDRQDKVDLFGEKSELKSGKDNFFDQYYYAEQNPEVAHVDTDLLAHYMELGWKEGRNPSRKFNTNRYLAAYTDVRISGMNPLLHFLRHGIREGRSAFAEPS